MLFAYLSKFSSLSYTALLTTYEWLSLWPTCLAEESRPGTKIILFPRGHDQLLFFALPGRVPVPVPTGVFTAPCTVAPRDTSSSVQLFMQYALFRSLPGLTLTAHGGCRL
ncbi:uncharacterized protein V1518DRAFT_429818 [Limtongia smithiae]|uniref:uncharacterized protein n=1 Tax=Limtongia smithiae TaxID=1125753 RepID=UPI0034CFBB13